MKFKDLVFLAEMNYGDVPGDVSQNVRDASLGEPPMKDTNPMGVKPRRWDHEDELDTPEGYFVVRFDAEYGDEVVDHDPGYSDRSSGRDIYASVPTDISDYEVVEIDDDGDEKAVAPDLEKKLLDRVWVKFSTNPDNYREVSSERDDYDDSRDRDDY